LIPVFALVALLYASVGFGGGSTYSALLAIAGIEHKLVPLIALLCNVVVVAGGFIRYFRAGLYEWRRVLPLLMVSAPMALLGGLIPLKESTFYLLLGTGLFLSSIMLALPIQKLPRIQLPSSLLLLLSSTVGLLAGLSGIGGGIFMSPVLHLVQWSDARRIAAFASFFILVNSLAGITGQMIKNGGNIGFEPALPHWPLMLAVLLGGQIGGHLGIKLFSPPLIRQITAVLVGYVAITLLIKGY
jgi:uncharacterized membrane protein YfcA